MESFEVIIICFRGEAAACCWDGGVHGGGGGSGRESILTELLRKETLISEVMIGVGK